MTGPGASGASGFTPDFGSTGFWGDILGATPAYGVDERVPELGQSYSGFAAYANTTKEDYAQELLDPLIGASGGVLTPLQQIFDSILTTLFGWLSEIVDLQGFIEAVDDILQWLYGLIDRSGFLDLLQTVGEFFGRLWELVPEPIFEALFNFLGALWEVFGDVFEAVATPILTVVASLLEALGDAFEPFLTVVGDFLTIVFEIFGDVLETVLRPIFNILKHWINLIDETVLTFLGDFIEWFIDLITIDSLWEFLEDIANFFTDILNPARFVEMFKALFRFFVDVFGELGLQGIIDTLGAIFGWLIKTFLGVLDFAEATIEDLFVGVKSFLARVPIIGDLLGLAGGDTVNGKEVNTLDDLVVWFQTKVLTIDKPIPAKNLFGVIPTKLLGSLGVGNVDDSKPNLVDLNTFPTAEVMQEGGRWSFDGSVSTEAGSGSAKVTCNSAAARMFSNKIPVAKGQLLSLRASVKWSGLSNNSLLSSPISIGVRTYNGGVLQQQFSEIASVATIGLAANSDWITLQNAIAWQVPADVDEVRMAIGVNQSATAGTVWFDDIALRKNNNLAQNLVTDLVGAWNGLIDGLGGNPYGTSQLPGAAGADVFTPANGTYQTADTASENADLALTGASGAAADAAEAASGVAATNNVLFGQTTPGETVLKDALPILDLGAELTTAGSGAMLSKRSTSNFSVSGGYNAVPTGFWDTKDRGSSDITVGQSGGFYTGRFTIHATTGYAGWYLVEVGYRLNPDAVVFGYQLAPAIFKNGSSTPHRVGSDATSASPGMRYVQASWIVYLDPGDYLHAGYNAAGVTSGLLDTDAYGASYFAISLLNRSYA